MMQKLPVKLTHIDPSLVSGSFSMNKQQETLQLGGTMGETATTNEISTEKLNIGLL